MKLLLFAILIIGLFSCSSKIFKSSTFEGCCFRSARGPLFEGNQICFYPDSKFKYVAHGPSIFVSTGYWTFKKSSKEIQLVSDKNNFFKNRIDTMWIDMTGKRIKVKSKRQLLIENLLYNVK